MDQEHRHKPELQQQHCCGDVKAEELTHTDPVCGMTVNADPQKSFNYRDTIYYFCGTHCIQKFSSNPEQYLQPSKTTAHESVPAS